MEGVKLEELPGTIRDILINNINALEIKWQEQKY
jgi:hypothetical protein